MLQAAAARRGPGPRRTSPWATCATGRPTGRSTSWSATPSCTGCPGHERLLARWAGWLAPGGWLAVQVPGNFRAPTHALLADLCRSPRWAVPAGRGRTPAGRRPGAGRLLRRPDRRRAVPRRVGDDVPARAHAAPTRCSAGSAAPSCGRCSRCLDDDDAGRVHRRVRRRAAGGLSRRAPTAPPLLPFRRVFAVATRPS